MHDLFNPQSFKQRLVRGIGAVVVAVTVTCPYPDVFAHCSLIERADTRQQGLIRWVGR